MKRFSRLIVGFSILTLSNSSYSQQYSKIVLDSSSHNKIKVRQEGLDSSQTFVIEGKHIDSNELNYVQIQPNRHSADDFTGLIGGLTLIEKIGAVSVALITIGTFVYKLVRKKGIKSDDHKVITALIVLLLPFSVLCQKSSKKSDQSSEISLVNSNNNVIKVIQGGIVHVYNLSFPSESNKLIEFLKSIPSVKSELDKILSNSQTTLNIVRKIYEQSQNAGYLSSDILLEKLEKYIKENERLKLEIKNIVSQDQDFNETLLIASKKLDEYDNEGYQSVLDSFLVRRMIQDNKSDIQKAHIYYLQAQNSFNNFKYSLSIAQCSKAMAFDSTNFLVPYLKAQALIEIFDVRSAINILVNLITQSEDSNSYNLFYCLGMAYYRINSLDSSLYCYRKCLKETNENFVDSGQEEGIYNNIALIYDAQGNFQEALDYYNISYEKSKQKKGISEIEEARLLNNIGFTYSNIGNLISSINFFNKSLAIYKKSSSTDILFEGLLYDNMGHVYTQLKDFPKANFSIHKSIEIREKYLGSSNIITARSYNNLGNYFYALEIIDSSLYYYLKAYKCSSIDIENGGFFSVVCTNLGMAYFAVHKRDSAAFFYKRAILSSTQDPLHKAVILYKLSSILLITGDFTNGLESIKKATEIRENIFGTNNILTAQTYAMLAAMLYRNNLIFESYETINKAIKIQDEYYKTFDPEMLLTYVYASLIYQKIGDHSKAFSYYCKEIILETLMHFFKY